MAKTFHKVNHPKEAFLPLMERILSYMEKIGGWTMILSIMSLKKVLLVSS